MDMVPLLNKVEAVLGMMCLEDMAGHNLGVGRRRQLRIRMQGNLLCTIRRWRKEEHNHWVYRIGRLSIRMPGTRDRLWVYTPDKHHNNCRRDRNSFDNHSDICFRRTPRRKL